jgi:hypothetical protein
VLMNVVLPKPDSPMRSVYTGCTTSFSARLRDLLLLGASMPVLQKSGKRPTMASSLTLPAIHASSMSIQRQIDAWTSKTASITHRQP